MNDRSDLESLFLPDLLHTEPPDIKAEDLLQFELPLLPLDGDRTLFMDSIAHTLHYADFIPPEAARMQQSMRYPHAGHQPFQNQHAPLYMFQVQPAFSPLTVLGQYDNWHLLPAPPDAGLEPATPAEPKRRRKEPKRRTHEAVERFPINYTDAALLRLLDLREKSRECVRDAQGNPISVTFRGFLSGRFKTNDLDNYNYYAWLKLDTAGGAPKIIVCYRRNFIHANVNLHVDARSDIYVKLEKVGQWRIETTGLCVGTDTENFILYGDYAAKDTKEYSRPDAIQVSPISGLEPVLVGDAQQNGYYSVNKMQFKASTSNSLQFDYQTYARIQVRLVAVTDFQAVTVCELESVPIIVRGRNPSFYKERQDISLKGRISAARESYTECGPVANELAVHAEKHDSESLLDKSDDEEPRAVDVDTLLAEQLTDSMGKPTNYKYFPITSVYYLPPIHVVYFPHRAHQFKGSDAAPAPESAETPEEKKQSRMYFR